ncbi:MAG TPA: hypothetical protein VNN80_13915 [Polyangiaceae bacterium]|jgi:hypothetical protein|nr:hypothetical protein [Polyangiaceae bacterium]
MVLLGDAAAIDPGAFPFSREVREYLLLLVQLLGAVAWPIAVTVILYFFRDVIARALGRNRDLVVNVAGVEIRLSAGEAKDALQEVFAEIDTVIAEQLTDEERQLFLRILESRRTVEVNRLLPGFARDTPEHQWLRALRGAYFIRPAEGGPWRRDKHVEVTTLGRLVGKFKRDALINLEPSGAAS